MAQSGEWVIGDEEYLRVRMSQDPMGLFWVETSRNTTIDNGCLKGTHSNIVLPVDHIGSHLKYIIYNCDPKYRRWV